MLQDPRWQSGVQAAFDSKAAKYPEAPVEPHALNTGWRWDTRKKPPSLGYDGKHGTTAGKYLAALAWYETFFGEVRGEVFVPKGLPPEDAAILREIAHKTVKEGLRPAPVARPAAAPAPVAASVPLQALAEQNKLDVASAPDPNAAPREQALARVDLAPAANLSLGKIVGVSGVKVSVRKGVSGGPCPASFPDCARSLQRVL